MGARAHMSPRLLQILPTDIEFGYVGRPERASPGEGYPAAHTVEQTRIIRTALDLSVPVSVNPKKQPGERVARLTDAVAAPQLCCGAGVGRCMKKFRFSGRAAIICSLILAIGVPSVAMGFGEGRNLLLGKRNPSNNPALALSTETRDHRQQLDLRHPPVQQEGRRRRRRDLRLPLLPRQRALRKAANLKGGRAFEFATVGTRGRPHRDRQPDRRAVHDQRHGRRHRPQRRQASTARTRLTSRRRRRHLARRLACSTAHAVAADGTAAPTAAARHRPPVAGRQRLHGQRSTRTSASARSPPRRSAPTPQALAVAPDAGQVARSVNVDADAADGLVPPSGDLLSATHRFARRSELR